MLFRAIRSFRTFRWLFLHFSSNLQLDCMMISKKESSVALLPTMDNCSAFMEWCWAVYDHLRLLLRQSIAPESLRRAMDMVVMLNYVKIGCHQHRASGGPAIASKFGRTNQFDHNYAVTVWVPFLHSFSSTVLRNGLRGAHVRSDCTKLRAGIACREIICTWPFLGDLAALTRLLKNSHWNQTDVVVVHSMMLLYKYITSTTRKYVEAWTISAGVPISVTCRYN